MASQITKNAMCATQQLVPNAWQQDKNKTASFQKEAMRTQVSLWF